MIKNNKKISTKIISFFLYIGIFLIPKLLLAEFVLGKCSTSDYTIATINGIFTDRINAEKNMDKLMKTFGLSYNNQEIDFQYLYNPTHGKVIDLLDAINQKYFSQNDYNIEDSDFAQMLSDASEKITTQKLLIVGHSQGNFYANTFYDAVVDEKGGVPSQSITVYGVASPSNRVAGGGLYLTSDTDKVIAGAVAKAPGTNILTPNIHIDFSDSSNGHSFSDIYLKYEGARIISDIKTSLDKLKNNDIQKENSLCISPPKLTLTQKFQGALLATIDSSVYVFNKTIDTAGEKYLALINYTGKLVNDTGKLVANSLANATAVLFDTFDKKTASQNVLSEPEPIENSKPIEKPMVVNTKIISKMIETKPIAETAPIVIASTPEPITAPILVENKIEEKNTNTTSVVSDSAISDSVVPSILLSGSGGFVAANLPLSTPLSEVVVPPPATSAPAPTPTPDTTPPVITILGANPQYVTFNSTYIDPGATALDAVDGAITVIATGSVDTAIRGLYTITYTATDLAGNVATATRSVRVASRVYVPFPFGANNGDGNNWQNWAFNGSNIYDWSDNYVNHYLHEQFKVHRYGSDTFSCGNCLVRGVFNRNPLEGFEPSNLILVNALDGSNPQFYYNGIYDIDLQWDATGYTYTFSHDGILNETGHQDIANLDANMWVGWSVNYNQFVDFIPGNWIGHSGWFPGGYETGLTGGQNMIMIPYPVYVP